MLGAIAVIAFLLYGVAIKGSFVFDDIRWIVNNPSVHDISAIYTIWQSNPTRFIGNLTFAATYSLVGAAPFLYHLTNIAIHICTTYLVYILIRSLQPKQKFIPLAICFLFLTHPIQTEAVTYIIQRMTSLAALFYLSSLIFYIRWAKSEHTNWVVFCISMICAILGYITKEFVYSLPFMVLLVEHLFGKLFHFPFHKRKLFIVLFFSITALTYVLTRTLILSHFSWGIQQVFLAPDASQHTGITRYTYALTQLHVLPRYLLVLLVPIQQNIDHDIPLITSITPLTIMSALSICCLLYLAWKVRKQHALLSFGIWFFFITMFLESSVFPIADLMVEHRLYLPSLGFFIVIVSLISRLKSHTVITSSLVLICMIYSGLTYTRNLTWRSGKALWTDTVKKSPHKMRPHFNLAQYLEIEGKLDDAANHYSQVISLDSHVVPAYVNLAAIYEKQGKFTNAKTLYEKALMINPNEQEVIFRLSLLKKYLQQH